MILEDIQALLSQFAFCSFSLVPCSLKKTAYWIVKRALEGCLPPSWDLSNQLALTNIICSDISS